MRAALTLVAAVCLLPGCGPLDDNKPDTSPKLTCENAQATELGVPSRQFPAHFRTSGGPVRFELRDTPTGLFEDQLSRQVVLLGSVNVTPEPDPGGSGPIDADFSVVVRVEKPALLDLPAGKYWVVGGVGRIRLSHCADVVLSEVEPPSGDPGELFGVTSDGA